MGIVNWTDTKGSKAALEIESSEEDTMMVLRMTPKQLAKRWQGKLMMPMMSGGRGAGSKRKIVVELRKSLGANVLIKIFDSPTREGNKLVHMSMNEAAKFTAEDIAEMNLAIAEGIKVYRHPAAWIKLNKELGNTGAFFP